VSVSPDKRYSEIVKSGTWKYDGTVDTDVYIVQQNWDYCYDEGFEDEPEKLNKDGVVYHVLFAGLHESQAFMHLEEAIREAESRIAGPIDWNDRKAGTRI
jgi:hypothetical protein